MSVNAPTADASTMAAAITAARMRSGTRADAVIGKSKAPSSASADVSDVAHPLFRVLGEAASEQRHHGRREPGWKRFPGGLNVDDVRQRFRHALAFERASAGQHLVEHRAERPHISASISGPSFGLLWRHVRGRTENDAEPVTAGDVIVGDIEALVPAVSIDSIAFASPKSSTFTVPSSRTLTFAGFKSRWMMPCSCAASSASAICFAIGSASAT